MRRRVKIKIFYIYTEFQILTCCRKARRRSKCAFFERRFLRGRSMSKNLTLFFQASFCAIKCTNRFPDWSSRLRIKKQHRCRCSNKSPEARCAAVSALQLASALLTGSGFRRLHEEKKRTPTHQQKKSHNRTVPSK